VAADLWVMGMAAAAGAAALIRVNKTNEQHCRNQFIGAEGALSRAPSRRK
jgi:hypothetical protein